MLPKLTLINGCCNSSISIIKLQIKIISFKSRYRIEGVYKLSPKRLENVKYVETRDLLSPHLDVLCALCFLHKVRKIPTSFFQNQSQLFAKLLKILWPYSHFYLDLINEWALGPPIKNPDFEYKNDLKKPVYQFEFRC